MNNIYESYADVLESYTIAEEGIVYNNDKDIQIKSQEISTSKLPEFEKLKKYLMTGNVIPKFTGTSIDDPKNPYGKYLNILFKKISITKYWKEFIDALNNTIEDEYFYLKYDIATKWYLKWYSPDEFKNCIIYNVGADISQDDFMNIAFYLDQLLKIIINKSLGNEYFFHGSADDSALFWIGKKK